jgi:hypothetical protein
VIRTAGQLAPLVSFVHPPRTPLFGFC